MKRAVILITTFLFLLSGCSTGENNETSNENGKIGKSGEFKSYSSEQKKEETSEQNSYTSITSDKAKDLLAKGNVVIIDVRKPEFFLEAHIPNAQNIPLDGLEARLAELDNSGTYLMVCKTGKTSETASELLAKNGFNNLFNLSGGMDAWTGEIEK
ncbi:rhodanese-like domain-containing protein [Bacillus sp. DNRA2]|uniref:rhodanese-like domain-containing protein n=1 Tax=Bacillus sp. DNRA2 TaxID=2723053 RepID=UPI00145D7AA0|nr:rhodanese-like domain-containing protein [Bacillus sp. DNRA2]NMD71220.1 rhodanese-like domain-containing protein [Bacillus sp. DNRA2]